MTGGKLEAAHEERLPGRATLGRWLFLVASALLIVVTALQIASALGVVPIGFANWRPTLYAFVLWGVALGVSQVVEYGEIGRQRLFVLPALLFTGAMVIFPTLFGLYIAFTDWNLNENRAITSMGSTTFARSGATPISGMRWATWSFTWRR